MAEPATTIPQGAAQQQAELFTVESVQGYAVLPRKERQFVEALFGGCSQTEAARRAGIEGSEEYLRKAACKLVRKGNVLAVLNQAWVRSGASIDTSLKQAAELQQRTFAEAQSAETPEKRKAAFAQWRDTTALIASIHGKLSLRIDGTMHHRHDVHGLAITVPESALPALAQMRRDVISERIGAIAGGEN